uniref:Uncharacterized protein n=1 Tax=Oryzias sinensis TaxID=183150 RepID=A0A8C7X6X2_9TELE
MRLASVKVFPQSGHAKGRSPRCVRSWRCRDSGLLKVLPQRAHGYGLSFVCMLRSCLRRSEDRMKSLPQGQPYGRSPVCSRLCCCSVPWWEYAFPQMSHTCGFRPECVCR